MNPEKKDGEIQFKPLTDGLGFHPFADGLPYAPASKTPTTGTGAVAAGRPVFVNPVPARPVDPTVAIIKKELEAFAAEKAAEKSRPAVAQPAPQIQTKAVTFRRHGLGYVLQRFFAYVIDSSFNLSVCAAVLSTAMLSEDIDSLGLYRPSALLFAALFLFFCNWALIAAQEVAFGTSLGKRIFGLKLHGSAMETFVRAVLFIPSLLFSGLGILMALFDSRKRCWHDRATQLQPEPN